MKPPRVVLDTQTALVVAVNSKGGRADDMRRFANRVLGCAWPPMRLVWESGARRSGSDVGSVGVSSWWPDPLFFIGRAANEGT